MPSRHSQGCSAGMLRYPNERIGRRDRRARGGGKRQKKVGISSRGLPRRGGAGPGGEEAAAAAEPRYRWVSLQDKERGRRGPGPRTGQCRPSGTGDTLVTARTGQGRDGGGGCRDRAVPLRAGDI